MTSQDPTKLKVSEERRERASLLGAIAVARLRMRKSYLCMRSCALQEYHRPGVSLSVRRDDASGLTNTFLCVWDRNPTKAVAYHDPVRRNRTLADLGWRVEIHPSQTRSAPRVVVPSDCSFPVLTALVWRPFHPRTRPARPRSALWVRAQARASCARPAREYSTRPFA